MRFSLLMLLVCLAGNIVGQQPSTPPTVTLTPLTVTPATVTLLPSQSVTLLISETDSTKLELTKQSTVVNLDFATRQLSALKVGEDTLTIRRKDDNATATLQVRVAEISGVTQDGNQQPLIQGEKRPITLHATDKDGNELRDLDLQLVSTNTNAITVETKTTLVGKGDNVKQTGLAVPIKVQLNGRDLTFGTPPAPYTFTITVIEAIKSVTYPDDTISLREGADIDLKDKGLKLNGKNGGVYQAGERTLLVSPSDHVEVRENHILHAKELPVISDTVTENITFTSPESYPGQPIDPARSKVIITVRPNNFFVEPNYQSLPAGGTTDAFTAKLTTRTGAPVADYQVEWKFADTDDYASIVRVGTNSAKVTWKDTTDEKEAHRPSSVDLLVTAKPVGSDPMTTRVTVKMPGKVVQFAPLRVKLTIMDEQTVADLYGKKTSDDYYVARVRLNNNLKNDPNTDTSGASILAFSDSIEVAVGLQKRATRRAKHWYQSAPDDTKDWVPVTKSDIDRIADTGSQGFDSPLRSGVHSDADGAKPELTCRGVLTYRPYSYEMVVNSADPREDRSTRAYVFRTLYGIGTLASFATAIAVPGPGSDLPVALEKYSNLLLPGAEKLFPNLKDTHRQNVISEAMRPIEEVPFGSDVSRILFFPKRPFGGLVRDNEVRISEICPHFFQIEVAVVKKGGKTTANAAAQ